MSMRRTSSGPKGWRCFNSSSASSAGWVAAHDGYNLTAMPVSRISQRLPRSRANGSSAGDSLSIAARKPCGPSIADALASMPARASRAASTPLRAAKPPCSGFTIVPKFSFRPEAPDAAMASACAVRSGVRPSSRAAAAAAPIVPSVEVQCHPRW